jgi:CubicO group peptidase (beta-lactamase class C family)
MLVDLTRLVAKAHAKKEESGGMLVHHPAMRQCNWAGTSFVLVLLGTQPVHADRVDTYLKSQMQQRRIPGVALKVIRDGKVVKTAAYGLANLEMNVPVKPETVFETGSITKQFTAAGILLLAQEGKLSVDDNISKYLKDTPEAWRNVTIRHLLTHTSGIKSYTGLNGFQLWRHLTQAQFIKAIGAQPMEFQPGDSWKYCNTGFNLLGYIIENVSGENYWDFLSERIFQPLGMHATTNRLPSLIIPNRAAGYEQTNQVWINRDYDLTDVFAAGAIASTVGDLAKWNAALDSGERILDGNSKEQMWTPVKLNDGKTKNYGFGWFLEAVEGRRNIGHDGSTSGFSASIQRFPDDNLAVIILTNTDEEIATTLARKVATFFFKRPVNARQGHGREREDGRPGFVVNCSHAGEAVASVHTTEAAR